MARVKIKLSKYQEAENLLKEAESNNSEYHEDNQINKVGIYTQYAVLYSKTAEPSSS